MPFEPEKRTSARDLKLAVTLEPESWILRRLGQNLQRFKSTGTDCRLLELNEPVPAETDAIVYISWTHLYQCPPPHREMPGVLLMEHLDRTAFRLRYLLWRYPRLQVICMAQRWMEVMKRYFVPEARLHLIYHGIDLGMFHPAHGLPESKCTRIGFVGRAYPDGRKGEDRLVEIGRQLSRSEYEFVLVGDRWEQVVAQLRAMGFSVEYHRQQPLEAVSAVVSSLDVLLVCARNEGGPQPVLEALACGVPVISTDVGFVPDLQKIFPGQITIYQQTEEVLKHLPLAKAKRRQAQSVVTAARRLLTPFTWETWAAGIERQCRVSMGHEISTNAAELQPDAGQRGF